MCLTNILFPVFIRLSTSRPLGERSEPFLAAKRRPRATKSGELDERHFLKSMCSCLLLFFTVAYFHLARR